MVRRFLGITILAILTCTAAAGGEFHFAARVDVIATLSVSTSLAGGISADSEAIIVHGTQDQCLAVAIVTEGDLVSCETAGILDGGGCVFLIAERDESPADMHLRTIQIIVN